VGEKCKDLWRFPLEWGNGNKYGKNNQRGAFDMIKTFIIFMLFILIGINSSVAEETSKTKEIKSASCPQTSTMPNFLVYQGRGCTVDQAKQKVENQLLDVCIANRPDCVESASCSTGTICTLYVLWDPVNEPNCGPAVVSSCPNNRGYVCSFFEIPNSANTKCSCGCIL